MAPAADPNTAFYGTWVGTLSGPDSTQRSGWSAGSRDSIWVVLQATSMKYYMSPTKGSAVSLSRSPDSCFVRYPAALSSLSDPHLSFRVNFSQGLHLGSAEPFVATRDGNTLTGSMQIDGDTLAGHWTATLCATCPDTAKECH